MASLTFVLIPGAGGSAWYWHLVAPELRKRGYDAVAVELPAADPNAGLHEYAHAVVQALAKHDRMNLALVAQSLGGFTAPMVCSQLPVRLLVMVNAMIPNPGETAGEWWTNTRHAEAKQAQNVRDGRPADAEFDPIAEFFHDVPQHVIDAAMSQGPPQQSAKVFTTPCAIDRWPDIPTRVLAGQDDRFFPVDFQRRVAQQRLGLTADEMSGGHHIALSRPVELAERLAGYALALPPSP